MKVLVVMGTDLLPAVKGEGLS